MTGCFQSYLFRYFSIAPIKMKTSPFISGKTHHSARRLRGEIKENREDAEGNENIAGQGENIGRSDSDVVNGNIESVGNELGLDLDTDSEIEIGAHLPANQNQDQGQQDGLQVGVDNISNQRSGDSQRGLRLSAEANGSGDTNGNGNSNGNGDEQLTNGQDDDDHGDDNGNGNGQQQVVGDINDKGEIDDDQNVQDNQVIRQPESKQTESKSDELVINNNLNRREIDKLIARARVLYSRPTVNREPNFDQLIQTIFDRYTELTNRQVTDQETHDLEQLTITADKERNEIKRIETELKELYEIAEHNRQPTFDLRVNNLWTTYSGLVDKDIVSSLREECDNLTLTANEIDELMEMEREKERVEEIEKELTELYNRTTLSRPLDFGYKIDNLFMELSRLKEVSDTAEFRAPYEKLTIEADNAVRQEVEKKKREIEQTKTDLRNQYLVLERNRNDRFSITIGYLFDKLTLLIGYDEADRFRQTCIDEHEEMENKEIINLGREFIAIARKPTFDRDMNERRKQKTR